MTQPYHPLASATRARSMEDFSRIAAELLDFHRATFGDARMDDPPAPAPTPPTPPAPPAPTPPPAPSPTPTPDPAPAGKWDPSAWDGKVESLPDKAQKLLTDARADAAKARTSAKEAAKQEARDELLKQLGLKEDGGEPADPVKLAADLAAKDQKIRDLTVRSALQEAIVTLKAKPIARAAILGDGVLAGIDPASDKFSEDVETAVKAYLEKNPELKSVQAAGSSSADHGAGGSGESGKPAGSLEEAIRRGMKVS